jgi:hypothetical protein
MAQGRHEEAVAFLTKYHGNGDPNARLVRLEVEEMREGIRIDGIDKRWWDCEFSQIDLLSTLSQLITNIKSQPSRPTFRYDPQRPLAFRSGYHDFHIWTVVW